jgi:cytosine/uracil/thiamine/allantoin permease
VAAWTPMAAKIKKTAMKAAMVTTMGVSACCPVTTSITVTTARSTMLANAATATRTHIPRTRYKRSSFGYGRSVSAAFRSAWTAFSSWTGSRVYDDRSVILNS